MTEKVISDFPEAPASTSVKIKSKAGFEWLFTMRTEKVSDLLSQMESIEVKFLEKGFTPLAQNNFSKPQVPTKQCTKHNAEMKEKTSQKTGKKYFSHYKGVFPNGESCFGSGFPSEQDPTQDY